VIAFLVPFVSMDEMNASKKHYPNTFDKEWKMIESEKYIKSINSQFRVNPCKILLPYQLHTEIESIDNLKNDDLILLRIKGIKGINSNNNMNVVGIYEKMFIDKTNFDQWKLEQENLFFFIFKIFFSTLGLSKISFSSMLNCSGGQ
jgi:hypothetical protein